VELPGLQPPHLFLPALSTSPLSLRLDVGGWSASLVGIHWIGPWLVVAGLGAGRARRMRPRSSGARAAVGARRDDHGGDPALLRHRWAPARGVTRGKEGEAPPCSAHHVKARGGAGEGKSATTSPARLLATRCALLGRLELRIAQQESTSVGLAFHNRGNLLVSNGRCSPPEARRGGLKGAHPPHPDAN